MVYVNRVFGSWEYCSEEIEICGKVTIPPEKATTLYKSKANSKFEPKTKPTHNPESKLTQNPESKLTQNPESKSIYNLNNKLILFEKKLNYTNKEVNNNNYARGVKYLDEKYRYKNKGRNRYKSHQQFYCCNRR